MAWNIQQGGAKRASRIVEIVDRAKPDILVLGELRKSSAGLLDLLKEAGFTHQVTGVAQAPVAAVGVLSRGELRVRPVAEASHVLKGRLIEVESSTHDVVIAGVYGPLRNERYQEFWTGVVADVPARREERFILAGDLNTGRSLLDADDAHFFCSQHFEALQSAGLIDVWRTRNGDARIASFHHRLKNGVQGPGFRLDHVLASPSIAREVTDVRYELSVLDEKVSDHAPIIVQFGRPTPR